MKQRILVYVILLYLSLSTCFAANRVDYGLAVTEMPLFDMLPSRSVRCIFQDSDGEMWFGTADGLCRDNGYSIHVYRPSRAHMEHISDNKVTGIAQASDGAIWFGTSRGVYRVNKRTQEVTPVSDARVDNVEIENIVATSDGYIWVSVYGTLLRFDAAGHRIKDYQIQWNNQPSQVHSIYEDRSGRIWITVWDGGLCRYERDTDSWVYYPWPYEKGSVGLLQDRNSDSFYVGVWMQGIARFNPAATTAGDMFTMLYSWPMDDERDNALLCMEQDDVNGYLWTTTVNGLQAYSRQDPNVLHPIDISPLGIDRYQMLTHIYKDRRGDIWVGGFNVPTFVISLNNDVVTYPLAAVHTTSGHATTVSAICYDDTPGLYWIFQERHRLYLYDMTTDKIESEISNSFVDTHNNLGAIYMMIKSRRYPGVWAASNVPAGIYRLQQTNRRISVADAISVDDFVPQSLYDDGMGLLWIGTDKGLYAYSVDTHVLNVIDDIGMVVDIAGGVGGSVVVAAHDEQGGSHIYTYHGGIRQSAYKFNDDCTAVAMTADTTMWVGTRFGDVWRIPHDSTGVRLSRCSTYTTDGYVRGLVTDSCGQLWVQTERRLTEIDPQTLAMRHYYVNEGHIGLFNFLPRTYAVLPSGELIFGGAGGFCKLSPNKQLNVDADASVPMITYVKVDGVNVALPPEGTPLEIPAGDHVVEIELGTSDLLDAGRSTYEYRVDGSSQGWISLVQGHNVVHLSRLSKGTHRIEIRNLATDASVESATAYILVHRKSAFYETWWFALLLLVAVGVAIVAMVVLYNTYKAGERRKRMESELVQMKFNFFTNITHELRTPLSLIITPLDALIRRTPSADMRKQLINIRRNAGELLALINRVLNFRRLEMGGERLSMSQGDIVDFVQVVMEAFRPMAIERNIDLDFTADGSCYGVAFDSEKLRIVLNNLLSNAFKFTDAGGSIHCSVSHATDSNRDWIVIKVQDTGCGIADSELPHVMEVFYQAHGTDEQHAEGNTGNGIGLYVANEYVKMHGGHIDVHSRQGEGSEFVVWLPVGDVDSSETAVADDTAIDIDTVTATVARKKILLVEDNDEFREFMRNELSDQYDVVEAADGVEGETMAQNEQPDVVISDVMMPRRDGFELCYRLKNDVATSSIPIILLSARTDKLSEMKGYENRADVYLTKPFNLGILLNRIDYLINRQAELQQEFKTALETDPKKLTISPLDETLLTHILSCVEANITNTDYGIAELSRDVNMSRMNLYRKLQAITGQTPTDFVKMVRLKKAALMLREGKHTIVEVAYAVGYSSPSYFTRSFKSEFGLTPSQYIETLQGGNDPLSDS